MNTLSDDHDMALYRNFGKKSDCEGNFVGQERQCPNKEGWESCI